MTYFTNDQFGLDDYFCEHHANRRFGKWRIKCSGLRDEMYVSSNGQLFCLSEMGFKGIEIEDDILSKLMHMIKGKMAAIMAIINTVVSPDTKRLSNHIMLYQGKYCLTKSDETFFRLSTINSDYYYVTIEVSHPECLFTDISTGLYFKTSKDARQARAFKRPMMNSIEIPTDTAFRIIGLWTSMMDEINKVRCHMRGRQMVEQDKNKNKDNG